MRTNAFRVLLLLSGLATAQAQDPAAPATTPAPAPVGPDGTALAPSDTLCLLHKELCLKPPDKEPPKKPEPPKEKTSISTETIISVETSEGQTRTVTVGETVTEKEPPKPTQPPPQPPPPQPEPPRPSTVTEHPQPSTVTQPGQETTKTITESKPGPTETIVQPPPQPPKEPSKEPPKQPSQTQPPPIQTSRPSESQRTSRASQAGPGPSGRPTTTRPVVTVGEAARPTGAVMIGALLGGAAAIMNI